MSITNEIPEELLKSQLLTALEIFRSNLKVYKRLTGKLPNFIQEKSAPKIPNNLLEKCKVYSTRDDYLKLLPKEVVVAEVGTQHGNWAAQILNVVNPLELHLFDIDFNLLRQDVKANKLVHIHKGDSSTQLSQCPDNYFDWIYIDGSHSYEGVKKDIIQAVKKIKHNGILIFNDYTPWSALEAIPYGIIPAVNELLNTGEWEMCAIALTPHGYFDVAVRKL